MITLPKSVPNYPHASNLAKSIKAVACQLIISPRVSVIHIQEYTRIVWFHKRPCGLYKVEPLATQPTHSHEHPPTPAPISTQTRTRRTHIHTYTQPPQLTNISPNKQPIYQNQNNSTEILQILYKCNSKKSYDIFRLNMNIVKLASRFIVIPLEYIFNLSFTSGKFPTNMKLAKVTPIFKNGNINPMYKL